jgi:hypothetical protein
MSNTDQGAGMDIDPPDITKPIDGRTREGRAAARAQQVGDDNGNGRRVGSRTSRRSASRSVFRSLPGASIT